MNDRLKECKYVWLDLFPFGNYRCISVMWTSYGALCIKEAYKWETEVLPEGVASDCIPGHVKVMTYREHQRELCTCGQILIRYDFDLLPEHSQHPCMALRKCCSELNSFTSCMSGLGRHDAQLHISFGWCIRESRFAWPEWISATVMSGSQACMHDYKTHIRHIYIHSWS